jgi:transcriptional regulator with XRE-family HTH domain
MSETLGQLIRDRHRQKGITQKEFANLLGERVRQAEISRLEDDLVRQPYADRLHRIAAVLGLPVGKLLMLNSWANPELKPGGSGRGFSMDPTVYDGQATNEDVTRFLDPENDNR